MIEDWENCHVDLVQGFLQLSNKVEKGANEIQGLNQPLVSFNIRWLWKYLKNQANLDITSHLIILIKKKTFCFSIYKTGLSYLINIEKKILNT